MIIVTCKVGGIYRDYNVYENQQEMDDSPATLSPINDCQPGDYVKTDNGYYLPVLEKYRFEKPNGHCTHIKFPRTHIDIKYSYKTGKVFTKRLIWYPEIHRDHERHKLSAKAKFMFMLIKLGTDFEQAYMKAYNTHNKRDMMRTLSEVMSTPGLYDYLKEIGMLEELKKEFTDAGCDMKWLAKTMMKIAEDPKEVVAMREKCMDRIWSILNIDNQQVVQVVESQPLTIAQKIQGKFLKAG